MRVMVPDLFKPSHRGKAGGSAGDTTKPTRLMARLGWELIRRFAVPDNGMFWTRDVLKACGLPEPGHYDIVMATGNPFSSFVAARALAKLLSCPFVLDYRDPWMGNPFCPPDLPWQAPALQPKVQNSTWVV